MSVVEDRPDPERGQWVAEGDDTPVERPLKVWRHNEHSWKWLCNRCGIGGYANVRVQPWSSGAKTHPRERCIASGEKHYQKYHLVAGSAQPLRHSAAPRPTPPDWNTEPMARMSGGYRGIWTEDEAGYLVVAWTAQEPNRFQVWGYFRNQTEAQEFGRKYFPRRYKLAGLHNVDHPECAKRLPQPRTS